MNFSYLYAYYMCFILCKEELFVIQFFAIWVFCEIAWIGNYLNLSWMVSAQTPALLVVYFMCTCFYSKYIMYVNIHNFENCTILGRSKMMSSSLHQFLGSCFASIGTKVLDSRMYSGWIVFHTYVSPNW